MSLNKSLLNLITEQLDKKPSKPKVPRNQWQHPGEITKIPGNNITMDGVSYPVMGVPNVGQPQMMYPDQQYHFPDATNVTEYPQMASGGYTVSRSSDRKGKTHKVTGPDGTVKYFGDSKLGQHPKDPERKKAFYARHKKNLDGNPYFRAFARETWMNGGQTQGGALLSKTITCKGCGHSWKATDGGTDPLTCHNCGADVKMQFGGLTRLASRAANFLSKEPALQRFVSGLPEEMDMSKWGAIKNVVSSAGAHLYDNVVYPIKHAGKFKPVAKDVKGLMNDMNNPESRRRLQEMGVDVARFFDKPVKYLNSSLGNSGYYPDADAININFDQLNEMARGVGKYDKVFDLSPRTVLAHEIGHRMQSVRSAKDMVDMPFAHDEIIDQAVNWKKDLKPFGNKVKDYFLEAKKNGELYTDHPQIERTPHLMEMKQNMLDQGFLRGRTAPVTADIINKFVKSGTRDRVANLVQPDMFNYLELSKLMNKLPAAAPVLGTGALLMAPKKKEGGQTRDEREMVNGIADILSQVNDPQNRAQIAQQMVNDFKKEDVTFDYDKFMQMAQLRKGGEMIKRADGSYSKRGLWDNIRANSGSKKKPTAEMLKQERKIKAQAQLGGIMGMFNKKEGEEKQQDMMSMVKDLAPLAMQLAPLLLKKGGSTYSGGVWYQDGGTHMMPDGTMMRDSDHPKMQYAGSTPVNPGIMQYILPQLQQQQAPQLGPVFRTAPQPAAPQPIKAPQLSPMATSLGQITPDKMMGQFAQDFTKQQQGQPAAKKPAMPEMNDFNKGLLKAQDKMMSDWSDPYSLEGITGLANNIVDGVNNRKNYAEQKDKQRQQYSTDQAYQVTGTNDMSRGQYDMYGQMFPDQVGGNLSFTGMNQKYSMQPRFDIGGSPYETMATSWIPRDIDVPDMPFIPKAVSGVGPVAAAPAPAMATAPANDAVTRVAFNLDGNFEEYARNAQEYLDEKAPGAAIKGVDLAAAAQEAYQKSGKLVPVELALAQLQIEGYLAKGNKQNKPQRTNNPFNVGNVDDGRVVQHDSVQSGIRSYFDLMTRSYLKDKTPDQLLQNFTNSKGNRYATDKSYEAKLRSTMKSMRFDQGGEVELTQDQIDHILRNGGEIEYI